MPDRQQEGVGVKPRIRLERGGYVVRWPGARHGFGPFFTLHGMGMMWGVMRENVMAQERFNG